MVTEHNAITEPVRRLEVFTGAGRRRRWSAEDKARIVAEIAMSGASVCAVARRHGLSPQQLFGWRRRQRDCQAGRSDAEKVEFVPAVVDAASRAVRGPRKAPRWEAESGVGLIEIDISGATIRIGRGADATTIGTVLRALKAGA